MLLRLTDHELDQSARCKQWQQRLDGLRAVVLLAGSVRASQLCRATGRSLLDLPVLPDSSVLDYWHLQLTEMARLYDIEELPVRVMLDRAAPLPHVSQVEGPVSIQVEQDPFAFRGTAGLLSDLARAYEPDDYILVANAAEVLLEPLTGLVESLMAAQSDVSMVCLHDGTPSGLILLKCKALRDIAKVGYVDLKEQGLPVMARNHDIRVIRCNDYAGLPVRTRGSYLEALREFYQRVQSDKTPTEALTDDEGWRAKFGLVETGAAVHPSAVVHDSVVLAGARVEPGAVLVRTVICPSGVVRQDESAVDCLVVGQDRVKETPWSSHAH
jgi:hypothetical protein